MSVNSKMTALADAIRSKTGDTKKLSIDGMITSVNNIETGITLPELSNEGSSSDLLSGKELIDGEGNVITGTIATKTSSNLTANGATVTVPAGYYASQATKSVASGSAKTPATTITKTPTISVNSSGLITASVSGTQNVTPTVSAGYVSSGTAGTITVSGSNTKQLTTQAAKTITPSTSSQTAVASGVYTTGVVTVAAIPSNYEDVGDETTEYTSLNAELEEVINSLPDAGSGGNSNAGEWIPLSTLPTTLAVEPGGEELVVYYEVPEGCNAVVFRSSIDGMSDYATAYRQNASYGFISINLGTHTSITDVDSTGIILMIRTMFVNNVYILPIYFNIA